MMMMTMTDITEHEKKDILNYSKTLVTLKSGQFYNLSILSAI
jgi:hypothetical protein